MAFFQAKDGTRLFYNDWGRGRPLVLIHGWPVDADMWEYQASALVEAGFRVVAYDRRGFGRSEQPWGGYDYDTLADDLAALIATLDLHQVTLVGFSMGGGEVARYGSRHGLARLRSVALISAVTPFLLETPDNPEGVNASVFLEIAKKLDADRPAFLASFAKSFYGASLLKKEPSSELLAWHQRLALLASGRATKACARAFAETDFRGDLPALASVPVLIIHGNGDETVPIAASARRTRALLPHATYIEYEGASHGLFFTEKERLTGDLLSFAQR